MFSIYGDNPKLYQWDTNRVLVVDDNIPVVSFSNGLTATTYDVKVVDGKANIPDEIFQDSWEMKCYAYDLQQTYYEHTFQILPRPKPADYFYNPTEIATIAGKVDKSGHTPFNLIATDENGDTKDISRYADYQIKKANGDVDMWEIHFNQPMASVLITVLISGSSKKDGDIRVAAFASKAGKICEADYDYTKYQLASLSINSTTGAWRVTESLGNPDSGVGQLSTVWPWLHFDNDAQAGDGITDVWIMTTGNSKLDNVQASIRGKYV